MKNKFLLLVMFMASFSLHAQYGHRYYYTDSTSTEYFYDGFITNLVLTSSEPVYVGVGKTTSAAGFERARFMRSRLSGVVQNNRRYFVSSGSTELNSRLNAVSEGASTFVMSGAILSSPAKNLKGGSDILLMNTSNAGVPTSAFGIDLNAGFDEALCTRRSARNAATFYTCGSSTVQGKSRAFLMKHNTSISTVNWVRTFSLPCSGTIGNAQATSVIDDSASNTIVIVGNVTNAAGSPSCQTAFIAKYSSAGVLQWLNYVTAPNGTNFNFQSIRATNIAQQYVVTGSVNVPGIGNRILLFVVKTGGAGPSTTFAKAIYSNGPSPNFPVASQVGMDVVTRIEPTKQEYYITGANQYTTNLSDGVIFKTNSNGVPLGAKLYSSSGKSLLYAIDYVSQPGLSGNGLAVFGNYVKPMGPQFPSNSLCWMGKTYFNLVGGCNEFDDGVFSLNLNIQYTAQTITFASAYVKDTLSVVNGSVLNDKICWATTLSAGSNTREADEPGGSVSSNILDIKLFPNPVNTSNAELFIEADSDAGVHIRVLDVLGKTKDEFRRDLISGRNELDLDVSNLSPGLYILQILDQNGSPKTLRFVRE